MCSLGLSKSVHKVNYFHHYHKYLPNNSKLILTKVNVWKCHASEVILIYNGYVDSWCGRDGNETNVPEYDSYIQNRNIDWQTAIPQWSCGSATRRVCLHSTYDNEKTDWRYVTIPSNCNDFDYMFVGDLKSTFITQPFWEVHDPYGPKQIKHL